MCEEYRRIYCQRGCKGYCCRFQKGAVGAAQVDGQRLSASFEEGTAQLGHSLQMITWALERLQVDPILDEDNPFRFCNPGGDVRELSLTQGKTCDG